MSNYGSRTAFPSSGEQTHGITIRDYFAAQALAGMLADLPKSMYGLCWQDNVATAAYELADAMLTARGAA